MKSIKPIETKYKGYRFRSRLEARWAVFFDALGIEWYYEPEGFQLSDGTMYLPDFYLPECHTFFEVKGIMGEQDKHKIDLFMQEAEMPVAIGYSNMEFDAPNNVGGYYIDSRYRDCSYLARCLDCGKLYFVGEGGSYDCLCCGYYNGNATFDVLATGDLDDRYGGIKQEVKDALNKARQARFEHGENG